MRAKSTVFSWGRMYFLEISVKCFLTSETKSFLARSLPLAMASKFSKGNLESIHNRPASVLRTASTLAPDLN